MLSLGSVKQAYVLEETLGKGTTSTCYRCRRTTDGLVFACKIIDKRRLSPDASKRRNIAHRLRREAEILKHMDHPNIAKLEASFEDEAHLILVRNGRSLSSCLFEIRWLLIYVDLGEPQVMELLQGGELFDAIVERERFTEEDAKHVARSVLSAMRYMHDRGVMHRDLKPENMLLTSKGRGSKLEVKIIDFGFAKVLPGVGSRTSTFLGTAGYLAPEILLHQPYNHAVDVWSFGVVLYLLLCGRVSHLCLETPVCLWKCADRDFVCVFSYHSLRPLGCNLIKRSVLCTSSDFRRSIGRT